VTAAADNLDASVFRRAMRRSHKFRLEIGLSVAPLVQSKCRRRHQWSPADFALHWRSGL